MGERNPVRGTLYLYIASFGGMGLAYVYWFVVARLTNPNLVGISSAAMSVVAMFLSLADLGIAQGVQRFLGKSAGQENYSLFREYLKSSVLIIVASTTASLVALFFLKDMIQSSLGLSHMLLIIIGITILVGNFVPIFRASLTSLLRTDYQAASAITAGLAKIFVGSFLIIFGLGAEGILLGSLAMYAFSLLLMAGSTQHVLPSDATESQDQSKSIMGTKNRILKAGIPKYIPGTIQTVGTQIGILLVFGSAGAVETGYYYIALQLFTVILLIPNSIMGLLYPYASGEQEKAPSIIRRGIKFSLLLSLPLVAAGIVYPELLLTIMGSEYAAGALTFQILLCSIPLLAIASGIHYFAYSQGAYRIVLSIGLATNVPRVILYILLTSIYGGAGAALSYFIGSITGVSTAIIAARGLDFEIDGLKAFGLLIPPIALGTIVYYWIIPWFLGIPLIVVLSIIIYMKTNLLSYEEMQMIIQQILPKSILERHEDRLMAILDLVY